MSRLPVVSAAAPDWFADGVRFRCRGPECGACCSGSQGPGVVWVDSREMERLARHLALSVEEVSRRFVRRLEGRACLEEHANYDCVFYRHGEGCTVYEARPAQCRTYPFWGRILASPATWEIEAEKCPGIGGDAPRVPAREVRRQLARDARRRASLDDPSTGGKGKRRARST